MRLVASCAPVQCNKSGQAFMCSVPLALQIARRLQLILLIEASGSPCIAVLHKLLWSERLAQTLVSSSCAMCCNKSVHTLTMCMQRPERANTSADPCAWGLRTPHCASAWPSRIPCTADSDCFTQEQRAASNKFSRFPQTLFLTHQASACWRASNKGHAHSRTPKFPRIIHSRVPFCTPRTQHEVRPPVTS